MAKIIINQFQWETIEIDWVDKNDVMGQFYEWLSNNHWIDFDYIWEE
jgi:hypothetical protein